MKRAIQGFGDEIRNGGVGLFYFSGHGVQFNGENYLIPVDTAIRREAEVEYESVNVGSVLVQMQDAGNRLNIVILDACRNNPFVHSFRSRRLERRGQPESLRQTRHGRARLPRNRSGIARREGSMIIV